MDEIAGVDPGHRPGVPVKRGAEVRRENPAGPQFPVADDKVAQRRRRLLNDADRLQQATKVLAVAVERLVIPLRFGR